MTEENFERLDDQSDSDDHEIVKEFTANELRNFSKYYAYCVIEKKRVSGDFINALAAETHAQSHTIITGHNTVVKKK